MERGKERTKNLSFPPPSSSFQMESYLTFELNFEPSQAKKKQKTNEIKTQWMGK